MIQMLVFVLLVVNVSVECIPVISNKINTTLPSVAIVGGTEVVAHSLPYQVAIFVNCKSFCGGVLISAEHVLTAAHCVSGSSNIRVVLGAHDLNCHEDTQKVFYNPAVIVHENYDKLSKKNDIALLKLNKRVKITKAIQPVNNLADADSGNYTGCTGLLSGWGFTSHTSTHSEAKLRQVYLDILPNHRCTKFLHMPHVSLSESQVCTSGIDSLVGHVGACFGDSGGPLVSGDTLVGLVSFGAEICEGGFPTVYTRISYFRSWIAKYSGV